MKLMTKEIINRMPKLYETEHISCDDKIAQVKFFNPYGAGTWYGIEYDPKEELFFGYVSILGGYNDEYGYFSLQELESIEIFPGLGIERDRSFKPTKMRDIIK